MTKKINLTPKEYEVGFRKPPKQTRFAKGQSGNPHGRPKGQRNWATVLHSILEQKVTVVENGRSKEVTKFEAATMQLVNRAAGGDSLALRLLLQIVPNMENQLAKAGAPLLSDEQDRKVLAELLKRMSAPDIEIIGPVSSNEFGNTGGSE
ncbi:MAG: DUF5681 domain-containing protein [Syntrophales bacterium]|jgi:hypothetical protein